VDTIAALAPPIVVCAAFIAIVVVIKKRADAEDKDER
jgi:hypothetical protein